MSIPTPSGTLQGIPPTNIMQYGAVNSGVSTPASSMYTLSQLTAKYGTTIGGVTVALTQEIDWLAYMLAYEVAIATGGTGLIEMPPGAGYVFTNANSASDGSGSLPLPQTSGLDFTGAVSIKGHFPNTVLNWPYAASAGGIVCGGRAAGSTGNSSGGTLEGLVLIGPGGSTTMQGILTNDRRNMRDIHHSGFAVGINVAGGQCVWDNVYGHNNNKYHYYFDYNNTNNFGNMEWHSVKGDLAGVATIGVHQAWNIPNVDFFNFGAFTCPWGIYKETNSGSPAVPAVMSGCRFYSPQFEQLGNGAIGDDRGSSARVVNVFETSMANAEFSWNSAYKLSGTTAYAMVDICQGAAFEIDINNAQLLAPGTVSVFNILQPWGVKIRGDLNTVMANCASVPFISGGWYDYNSGFFEQTVGGNWKGRAIITYTVPAVGSVVAFSGSDTGAASTGSADVVAGVSVYAPPSGSYSVVATSGSVTANTTGTITGGKFLYPAASGNMSATASGSPIAVAGDNNTGASYWVMLRGLA